MMACDDSKDSDPPRRIAALPDFRHNPAASAVTQPAFLGAVNGKESGLFLVKVVDREPAHIPALKDIQDRVRDALVRREAEGKARDQAQALLKQIKNAADFNKIAEANHLTIHKTEPFDRAWRRVGLALDRSSFTVEDRNRSKGIYYVRYIDPDSSQKKPGFFSRLFGKKKQAPTNEYQIFVKGDETASQVDVLDKDGVPDKTKTGDRILTLLYEQLK